MSGNGNTCYFMMLCVIIQAAWPEGKVKNPIRGFCDVGRANGQASISCSIDIKGTHKPPSPDNEPDDLNMLFGTDTYSMNRLGLEDALRGDVSRALGMVEAQKGALCGDQQ